MKLKLNKLSYGDIKIGDVFSFDRLVDAGLVNKFAEASGDFSPLHVDAEYGKATQFGGNIAHGMLLGSFFSAIVGMLCPGEKALYLSQSLNFKKPLPVGGDVKISGKVSAKSDAGKVIEIEMTVCGSAGEVLVDGLAKVLVRD